jgi:hypothetical protein
VSKWEAAFPAMRRENITLANGAGKAAANLLLVVGLVGIGLAFAAPSVATGVGLKHSLASVHIGAMTALAASLGGIFFVMVFSLISCGWSGLVRRQFENLAAIIWVPIVLVGVVLAIEFIQHGVLFKWIGMHPGDDPVLDKKAAYLNTGFFLVRAGVYAVVWIGLAMMVNSASRKIDETGDKVHAAKLRKASTVGMILFALTTSFAAFDWLKSMDYAFFSTMWGVYYFSGAAFTAVTGVYMILAYLRGRGKLEGLVTEEHFHDLGKLMFAFTCFWAYIAFFQYFLIWYANIPEETAWYIARKDPATGWDKVFYLLCFGHFIVPFIVLIQRPVKRNPGLVLGFGVWLIAMQALDIFWIVRPMVYAGQAANEVPGFATTWWIDSCGILGVLAIYGSFLVRKIASRSLVALDDPRMSESLRHKNYV